MNTTNFEYFESLAKYAQDLLDRLPIEKEPQPLDYAVNKLNREITEQIDREILKIAPLWSNLSVPVTNIIEYSGLNTLGMLLDRFTILLIKEWCLRNKNLNLEKANELFKTQTIDIIHALANCKPGNSSINSKITNIKTTVTASSWEEAFYKLLGINLVLWESQEVLYIKDISTLPSEELRDYIKWFAYGNMQRNVLIELAEMRYWEKIKNPK